MRTEEVADEARLSAAHTRYEALVGVQCNRNASKIQKERLACGEELIGVVPFDYIWVTVGDEKSIHFTGILSTAKNKKQLSLQFKKLAMEETGCPVGLPESRALW